MFHLDRPMYLLGYLASQSRVYLIDKVLPSPSAPCAHLYGAQRCTRVQCISSMRSDSMAFI